MSIYNLNDYCLQQIFSYFSIYELIALEDVCQLFKYIAGTKYSIIRKLKLDYRTIEEENIVLIFQRLGCNLEKFEFSGGYIMSESIKMKIARGLASTCKLDNLKLNYMQMTHSHMNILSPVFQNLTYLDLSRCNLSNDVDEQLFRNNCSTNKLRQLKVAGNIMITGAFLANYIYLDLLDISYCYNLDYFFFNKFIKSCLNLKYLDISGCVTLLSGNVFEDIAHFQPNIKELYINDMGLPDSVLFNLFPNLRDNKMRDLLISNRF